MAGSSRRKSKVDEIPHRTRTACERLHQAINLGIKCERNTTTWQTSDATISVHALRAMSLVVDCIYPQLLHHPLVKDSISSMFVALEGILQSKNVSVLGPATDVTKKLFLRLGNSSRQYLLFGVLFGLCSSLSSKHAEIAISSAMSLKHVLKDIGTSRNQNKEIWNIFTETGVVESIMCFLLRYVQKVDSLEDLLLMLSFLKEILWRWPLSRYQIWSNKRLMDKLGMLCSTPDLSLTTCIMRVFSNLALCDDAALEFVKSKEPIVSNMVQCMGSSIPDNVVVEALNLCQHLMKSEKGCSSLMNLCCEPIVQGMIDAMSRWRSQSTRKVSPNQMHVVQEACIATKIVRWSGCHHFYYWKYRVDEVLVDLMLGDYSNHCKCLNVLPSFKELENRINDNMTESRRILWDILGGLAQHCTKDYLSKGTRNMSCLDALISSACLVVVGRMLRRKKSCGAVDEPASRALLLMIYSPCKYIAARSRNLLSEMLGNDSKDYLQYLLDFLNLVFVERCATPDNAKIILSLVDLACFSALPQYQSMVLEKGGLRVLLATINWCLGSDIHLTRSTIVGDMCSISGAKAETCCISRNVEQEIEDIILLYSLKAVSQLICICDFVHHHPIISSADFSSKQFRDFEAEVSLETFENILDEKFTCEIKWYSAFCLSLFGTFGFPSKIGKRMKRALNEKELFDIQLILGDKQCLEVHGVVLMTRCPSLLPAEVYDGKTKLYQGNEFENEKDSGYGTGSSYEVRLTNRITRNVLEKLLEYVYTGVCKLDVELVKPMKILAKSCGLRTLHSMLQGEPSIGNPIITSCDFAAALHAPGHAFSDIILEAKETVDDWNGCTCPLNMPHVHAHKIILYSNSAYMQALFESKMLESHSKVYKVPLSWKALVKLTQWFYSGKIPKLNYNCTWFNTDKETQSQELLTYMELSWLADFWCLEEIKEDSVDVIESCVRLCQDFPVKIIQHAVDLGQWDIVGVLVQSFGPQYPRLSDSGDLEGLDDVRELLRKEYVYVSQSSATN